MARVWPLYLFLGLLVVLLGGFAYFTQNPASPHLERAAGWPVVGPAADAFRRAYLPPEPAAPAPVEPTETEVIRVYRSDGAFGPAEALGVDPSEHAGGPWSWLGEGERLLAEPREGAELVAVTRGLSNVGLLERRGDWARVSFRGHEGWVPLARLAAAAPPETTGPPLGSGAAPAGPLAARPPDPERLAHAGSLLAAPVANLAGRLGPYAFSTDLSDPGLVAYLDRVAAGLEPVYRRRFGLRPVGAPAEAVVLFTREADYRAYQSREQRIAHLGGTGHTAGGVVALYVGDRRREEIAATLVHELVHLLNRRALGPALPPWLDEGLADSLAFARLSADGELLPTTFGGSARRVGEEIHLAGGRAAVLLVHRSAPSLPRLPDLLALDWDRFVAPGRRDLHYAQSALFLRYLLDGESSALAPRLRAFLAAVAAGEPPTAETLRRHLDRSWTRLDAGFRAWVRLAAG